MKQYLEIIRIKEWWLYLIPRYLGIIYLLIELFCIDFGDGLKSIVLLCLVLLFTASFAYLLNEITDYKDDLVAGKIKNGILHTKRSGLYYLLFLLLLLAFIPWLFLPVAQLNFGLFCSLIVLLISYSVPPLRLKRYAVPSIIIDSLYNSVVMLFVLISTIVMYIENEPDINFFVVSIVFIWSFLKGLRGIILHQIEDRKYDKKTGIKTFPLKYGALNALNIVNRYVLPLEFILMIFILVYLSITSHPFLWLIFLIIFAYGFYFFRLWERKFPGKKREANFRYIYILNDIYEEWLPIVFLFYLPFLNPWYLILLPIHLSLFYRIPVKLYRNAKKIMTNCRDFIHYLETKKIKPAEVFHFEKNDTLLSKDNKIVHGLWVGTKLSYIEQLTIKSYIRHGHEFHLWVYDEIENLPEGVVVRDANQIIKKKDIIVRKYNDPVTGVGKGSVGAPFSDIFRYKLLYEYGGWWVDLDVTCLKPLQIDEPYFFRDHLLLDVIGNVMKCPKGSELMWRAYEEASTTCDENTLDWLLPNKILNKHINALDLLRYRQKGISNKDKWPETKKFIRGLEKLPEHWLLIHWSNEEWRMNGLDKNHLRLKNTTLGVLMEIYEVKTQKADSIKMLKNDIRLARPVRLGVPPVSILKPFQMVYWYFHGHVRWWMNYFFKTEAEKTTFQKPIISYCTAPVKSLYFDPNGHVLPCCYNRSFLLGKYPENSVSDIWGGDKLRNLRSHLDVNNFSLGCKSCKLLVEANNFEGAGFTLYKNIPAHEKYPTCLEFELTNTCNLECIMCSGEFSSSIRRNRENLPELTMKYDDQFVDQLIEFIPYLKEAKFLGGEPFLTSIYFKIWEKIVEINPQCLIDVQTNGTVLNSKLIELLYKGNFRIGISIDSLEKDVYESIRLNSNFDAVKNNLDFFIKYSSTKNLPLSISICPMTMNWKEIPQIFDYFNEQGFHIYFNTVVNPRRYSLKFLAYDELNNIISYLKNNKPAKENVNNKKNFRAFQNFMDLLMHWKTESLQKEDKLNHFQQLEIDEILVLLTDKLLKFCNESDDYNYSREEIELLLVKKNTVISNFQDKEKVKNALFDILNNISEGDILNILKNCSLEELFEKAKSVID